MTDFYLLEDEIATDYIKHVLQLAEQQGLNIDTLLEQAGMNINPLEPEHQHLTKMPARYYEKLCRCVQHKLSEFSFRDTRFTDSFEILCHTLESASTLREAIKRIVKYINLMHIHDQPMRSYERDGYFCFSYVNVQTNWSNLKALALEAHILFFWHRFFNWLIDDYITLQHVGMTATQGEDNSKPLFNCAIEYDHHDNHIAFDRSYLDKTISRTGRDYQDLLNRSEYNFFLITDSHIMPVAKQVQMMLDRQYPNQFPSLDLIAEQLHMSVSSLRRRLKRENTSYQGIKDRLYKQRAIALLQRDDMTISDIAEQLGFNDSSCFQRAFKRWTGETPGNYRLRLKN